MNKIRSQSQKTVATSSDADIFTLDFWGGFSPFSSQIDSFWLQIVVSNPCFINISDTEKYLGSNFSTALVGWI